MDKKRVPPVKVHPYYAYGTFSVQSEKAAKTVIYCVFFVTNQTARADKCDFRSSHLFIKEQSITTTNSSSIKLERLVLSKIWQQAFIKPGVNSHTWLFLCQKNDAYGMR